MNTLRTVLTATLFLLITSAAFAQSEAAGEDYFIGKWDVLVQGTPNGDAAMIFNLQRDEDQLAGYISGEDETETIPFDRIAETEESITVYFFAEGHNVNITLNIVDENSMTGHLMGMFNSSATRIVE
ncbi:MAG: hypothetical protein JJU37_06685 [Balneolaceae bacterium]|nr:hypothetical protein [Balneolaceae bacterium]